MEGGRRWEGKEEKEQGKAAAKTEVAGLAVSAGGSGSSNNNSASSTSS